MVKYPLAEMCAVCANCPASLACVTGRARFHYLGDDDCHDTHTAFDPDKRRLVVSLSGHPDFRSDKYYLVEFKGEEDITKCQNARGYRGMPRHLGNVTDS